jgi:flagellar hook-associated protein 1
MSLSQAISNGNQGLSAAARATDIVSTNLANAQTEGYVRRSVLVTERVSDGKSLGLNPVITRRNEESVASNNVRRSDVTYQQQKVITDATKIIQQAIGNVDDEYSLTARMDNFRNALKNLAATPENAALQDQTIFEAKEFTRTIRTISGSIQEIRESADNNIKIEVDNINKYLVQLKDVNSNIASLGSSTDVAGLQDEQERLLNKINEIIPVNVSTKENGTIGLATKTGVTLLDINIAKIEFSPSSFITPEKIYAYAGEAPGLPYNAVLSGLKISDQDITPSSNKIQSLSGGKLGGLFEVRDDFMVTIQKQLDSIAGHFITSFRSVDRTTDTDNNMVNGNVDSLFTAGNSGATYNSLNDIVGISNKFTINSQFDSSVGGDKRRIRDGAMATSFTGPEGNTTLIQAWITQTETLKSFDASTDLSQSQSLISSVREFVSSVALKNQNQLNNMEYEEGKMNTLLDIRDNAEGVNIDEQTQQMLFLQRVYQANAVLIKTAGEMFDTILSIAG